MVAEVTEEISKKEARAQAITAAFDKLYAIYPRHEARTKAATAWRNLTNKERAECEQMLPAWLGAREGKERQFIPILTTFIHGRRWRDEAPPNDPAKPKKPPIIIRAEDRRSYEEQIRRAADSEAADARTKARIDAGVCFVWEHEQATMCEKCWEMVPALRERWQTRANCRAHMKPKKYEAKNAD